MDAATPEIKDDMVGVSDAIPRYVNQEKVRTNRENNGRTIRKLVFIVILRSYECISLIG